MYQPVCTAPRTPGDTRRVSSDGPAQDLPRTLVMSGGGQEVATCSQGRSWKVAKQGVALAKAGLRGQDTLA